MKAEEEILIQNKIDGNLSQADEARFNQLIQSSDEAKTFYNHLKVLDEELHRDAAANAEIDLTASILGEINKENNSGRKTGRIIGLHRNTSSLLKYAAILVIGLVIGSLATMLNSDNSDSSLRQLVRGTIGKPVMTGEIYNEEGTRINVQQLSVNSMRLIVVDVESAYGITCRVKDADLNAENVQLLSGNNSGFSIEDEPNALLVHSTSAIYQIRIKKEQRVELEFYFNNQLLRKISFGEANE